MKKGLIWITVLAVLAMAGVGVVVWAPWKSEGDGKGASEETAEVVLRDFTSAVLAMGTVKPQVGAQVNVGARISGKVDSLSARIGDRVKKGDVLATIEHKDLMAQVAAKQAQIESLRTQIRATTDNLGAETKRLEVAIQQRQLELDTERRRLEALQVEGEADLTTERARLESIRSQRKAEKRQASTTIQEAASNRELAEKDLKRMQTLYEKGMLAEQSLDQARSQLDGTESRLRSSRSQRSLASTRLEQDVAVQEELLRQKEAQLREALALQQQVIAKAEAAVGLAREELESRKVSAASDISIREASIREVEAQLVESEIRLSYATVTAPINGVVGTISTQEGETVAAGFNAPTFVTVVDISRLQVDAYVDEVDIGRVKTGQKATFTVDAFPGVEFQGVVQAIYPTAILQDNLVYYDVVISIENLEPDKLRPEMTVNASIVIDVHQQVPAIPLTALQRKEGKTLVMLKTPQGVVPTPVKAGLEDDEFVEIPEGVKPGDVVVLPSRKGPGGEKPGRPR
jgi:RND family efflux transporter MFP subunit